jgi:hypothetical protein
MTNCTYYPRSDHAPPKKDTSGRVGAQKCKNGSAGQNIKNSWQIENQVTVFNSVKDTLYRLTLLHFLYQVYSPSIKTITFTIAPQRLETESKH